MCDNDKEARIWWQTQTKGWESMGCNSNDKDFREFAHDLLDEWLDWMEGKSKGDMERQTETLMHDRLWFQACDSDSHYEDEEDE